MNPSTLELLNESFTLATLPNKSKVVFQINQAFLDRDPLKTEALLQPHQMRAFGLVVDDCAHRHISKDGIPGGEMSMIELWGRIVVPFLLNMVSYPIQYVFRFKKLRGEINSGGGRICD